MADKIEEHTFKKRVFTHGGGLSLHLNRYVGEDLGIEPGDKVMVTLKREGTTAMFIKRAYRHGAGLGIHVPSDAAKMLELHDGWEVTVTVRKGAA